MALPKIRIKFTVQEYLEFTSVFMIFLQGFAIKGLPIFDVKLFYFFLILNSLILFTRYGVKIHKYLFLFLTFVVVHGIISYLIYNIPWINLVKQVLGISFVSIYYYNVVVLFNKSNLFQHYLNLALVFCVIAIIFYPTGLLDKEINRLDGLMSEPSKFIIVNVPALYYFLKSKKYFLASVLFIGFILAKSSSGYLAIILMLLFIIIRKNTIKYLGLSIIPLFVFFIFLENNEFYQDRKNAVQENLEIFKTKAFTNNTNISAFVLLKSAFVSFNNFKDHPLGTGIGSFASQHDKYILELDMPRYTIVYDFELYNREDANSLFLRILSDLGIFGILLVILFICSGIFAHLIRYDPDKKAIAIGIFIYFLVKLLRMGHYFPEEQFFFLFIYLFLLPNVKFLDTRRALSN